LASVRSALPILVVVALGAPVLFQAAPAGALNVVTVTSTADGGPGSLRDAIDTANADGDDTEIGLQPGATYNLARCGTDDDVNAVGDLDHTEFGKELTIAGTGAVIHQTCPGQRAIHEMGSRCSPDHSICFSLTLRITDLTITGGNVIDNGGAILTGEPATQTGSNVHLERSKVVGNSAGGNGGAVSSSGGAFIDSVFDGNTAGGSGGALHSFNGTINSMRSTFVVNSAGVDGGALHIAGSNANIHDSTFLRNSAAGIGGAALAGTGGNISGSTFTENVAANGGAVAAASVTATNSTFTGNTARVSGGGIGSFNLNLTHVTVVENSAPTGSNLNGNGTTPFTAFGSVVALPHGGGTDCAGVVTTSQGYNFDSDASCGFTNATDQSAAGDPHLQKLQNNGGPTPTRHPQKKSPLIDTIPPADCRLPTDQRGVNRPQSTGCDTGSVEVARRRFAP
jgi:predicted outer membrane repeat protein